MKFKHLFLVLVLVMASLIASKCANSNDDPNDPDPDNPPNFVQETCSGCPVEETIGNVTSFIFYSYVKNNGGAGKISMTIDPGNGSATMQFDVTTGTSYRFQATIPVVKSATTTFSYSAKFAGSPGYTDTRTKTGYHVTGAPTNLRLDPR